MGMPSCTRDLYLPLQEAHGPRLTLAIDPEGATLAELKAKVEAQTGVPALSQSLSLGDVALADGGGGTTLGAQGVASGGTVVLSLPPDEPVPARTGAVEVEVPPSLRPLYGASLVVAAPAAETVGELKARVAAVTGLSAAAQALASDGTPLADDGLPLADAGVPSGGGLALSVPLTDGGATLAALGVPNRAALGVSVAAGAEDEAAKACVVHVELPPSLQPAHGASLTLASSPAATVDELLARLAALTGMGAAEQQLAFAGVPLINGTQTLAAAGVGSGATLELCTRAPHVRVHLPEALQEAFGPTVTVAAGPTDTLAAVAALVVAHTGVTEASLRLSYAPPPATFVRVGLPEALQECPRSSGGIALASLLARVSHSAGGVPAWGCLPAQGICICRCRRRTGRGSRWRSTRRARRSPSSRPRWRRRRACQR